MIESPILATELPLATAGEIAIINLESTRRQSWSRFWQSPERPGIAEYIVEQEQLTAQYLGDLSAFDRLQELVAQIATSEVDPARRLLIQAQVASMTHRFAESRILLQESEAYGPLPDGADRLLLSIDQACGTRLDDVLRTRRQMAAKSGRLEDLVPLGALLADLREFGEADQIYQIALSEYRDVSPFAVAWVCFQLGVLWGELVPDVQSGIAACWYEKAIEYLPCYVKARVHLSEIYLDSERFEEAEALLVLAIPSGDPEVSWRLADVMAPMGRAAEAETHLQAAQQGFEALLDRHLLAFADHGVEFYLGSGGNAPRAFELARINLANRPTLRAFEQAYDSALAAKEPTAAYEILSEANEYWGGTKAFSLSHLSEQNDLLH
jgi:tetratricopeptide (TPR) repeat protein